MRMLAALLVTSICFAQRPPVEQAWDLAAHGQRDQAIQILRDLVGKTPRDADARLLLGSLLVEKGVRSEAISQLMEAVHLRPQSAEAQNALGEAYNAFGNTKAARE